MNYQHIETASEEDFLAESVALLKQQIVTAIEEDGLAIIGLSGGSTPKPIYEALGKESIDWSCVSVFLVDERYVPRDSDNSNQKLVYDTLLKHASIPEQGIVFPDTSLPLEECVKKYAADLQFLWAAHFTTTVTLGLGTDGHIASLFPPLSDDALGEAWLVGHTKAPDQFAVPDRITVQLNALAAADHQVFFLKGEGKKATWEEMLASDEDEQRWPAKRILEGKEAVVVSLW